MSKLSNKSGLSPSITKGSSGIDLGKNNGVDMGQKSEPSITSGGIGVTQEVTNIGGMNVTGGVSVEISPVNFGISTDPSEGSISVAGGAELPGGIVGISGGVTIDANTGEIIGGSIGGELGGLGINVSNSKEGGLGIEFTVQIPGTPIEISLGFGFPKNPTPTQTPSPTPSPTPRLPTTVSCPTGSWVVGGVGRAFDGTAYEPTARFYEGYEYIEKILLFGQKVNTYNEASGLNVEQLKNPDASLDANATKAYPGGWKESIISYEGYFPDTPSTSNGTATEGWVGHWYFKDVAGNYTIDPRRNANGDRLPAIKAKWKYKRRRLCDIRYNGESWWYWACAMGVGYDYQSEIEAVIPAPPCPPPKSTDKPPTEILYNIPFPNPPPRKRRKMDNCCKETLKFLRAIYTGLGIAKFPGQLPATIIQEVSKEGEQPAEPPQVPIKDFVDLLDWQFKRDDERWGQWVVQIDVKDADITKEGDQGKQIKFPNLAESIAELEGQMLSLTANVDGLVALQVKNLAESNMARQEAIKGYLAAKAIIKYMAFKSSEIDVPIPMTFTAGAESISELLKESEGHIKGTDYSEKETLRDVYLDLLQAAAIIRAVHWQKIDSKNDTKTQLLNILKGTVDLAGLVSSPKRPNDGEEKKFDPEQNFEDFIDSVEDGFRNTTGISDIQNPYGRTPDRRPRIREIGDNLSEAGADN